MEEKKAKTNVKADAKPKANANAKTNTTAKPKAETAAKAKTNTTAKPKTDTIAKAKSSTTARPKTDTTTKAKASATTSTKADASVKAKVDTKPKSATKANVETKAKASASEKSTANAKTAADAKMKKEVAEKPKQETSTKPKADTNSKAKAETTAKPKADVKTDLKEKSKSDTTAKAKADKKPKEKAKSNTATNKNKVIVITVIAVLAILVIILSIAIGVKSCSKPKAGYQYPYKSVTSVGYYAEQIGTVDRVKPVKEIKNGGLSAYPEYGKSLNSVLGDSEQAKAARQALIAEASFMTSSDTWNGGDGGFTWMDKDGWLYSGKVTDENLTHALEKNGQFRRLYQHSASKGLYGGDVADEEPGIIKQVTLSPRGYNSYSITGVYAPAGEVIKIEISEKDMDATGGITIHIGQALYNGKANNIWMEKNVMNRFPIILNTMKVNKDTAKLENGVYTAYVGSFLGGPLYIRNTNTTITATISGGVAYSHYIHGYTTKEEFEENAKSSAPYFDLEVRNYGVLHSGPKQYSKKYSFDDLYKVAVLWEKVSLVSTTNSNQGIVFLYDPFVAAGAAVAFPGQQSVNCPMDWMDGSLNYEGIITSGSWGNFHEYHHNFQGYGVGNGGEVTNNGMSLVSYALFTKISSARNIQNFGAGGLGGWNRYTSATWALEQTLKIDRDGEDPENGNQGLSLYATLLHNFGADNYIQSKKQQQITKEYGEDYVGYMRAWQDITHNDMTYFFKDVLKGIDDTTAQQYKNSNYSTFVPVSSVYQTGRSYMYDGKKQYITTAQPYVIPADEPFTIDLNRYTAPNGQYESGSIVLPEGFTYKIKKVSKPQYGKIKNNKNGIYTYTPDSKHTRSGEIIVTLEIKRNDNQFKVDDVDLVLEFETTREHNKYVLQRTTYTFDNGSSYTDAVAAFNEKYKGYSNKVTADNVNKTQNSNTDIWYTNQEGDEMPKNAVVELEGKIYVDETAKYRIAIRGRYNVALFVAINDSNDYKLAAKYIQTNTDSPNFSNAEGTYKDMELKAGDWVKFKAVMITGNGSGKASFMGLGWGKFTPATGTIDEDGNLVGAAEESVSVSYANAYRSSYEFPSNDSFKTDYFYKRNYSYDYKDNVKQSDKQTLVSTNYDKSISWNINEHKTENLFDGNKNTFIHTGNGITISQDTPLTITADLGSAKPVNRITIYTQYRPNGDWHCVKSFNLYGSADGSNYSLIGNFTDVTRNGTSVTVDFAETTIRYYKIDIVESTGRYVIIGDIELWRSLEVLGGNQLPPGDDTFTFSKKWTSRQAFATFGQVYVGKKGDKVTFEFEGDRLAILSSKSFKTKFEVYIDGKRVSSIDLKEDDSLTYVSYMSPELKNKKHKVTIKCKGESNIDSIVIYSDKDNETKK